MHDELATLSDRKLQQVAYGRVTSPHEQARADAAGAELARRAAVAASESAAESDKERQVRDAAPAADDVAAEHPASALSPPDRAHRRRMRAVGLAGVLAAAIAVPAIAWALSLPDPDPLAIFDGRESTADTAFVTDLLGPDAESAITVGPQLVRLDDGLIAIAFRASTVPDGRSTDWDAFCLLTTRDPKVDSTGTGADTGASSWQLGGSCVSPERFDAVGVLVGRRPTPGTEGSTVDVVRWGPEGSPQIVRNLAADDTEWSGSPTDALAYGGVQSGDTEASLAQIDGSDRVIMGPAQLASANGVDGRTITVSAYLIESAVEGTQGLAPEYCLQVGSEGVDPAVECAALPLVEREGLSVRARTFGGNWLVELGTDGSIRLDRF